MNTRARRTIAVSASVLGVYAMWLVLVSPNGDFPLDDDWAYSWSVRRLLDTGHLRLSDWSSATSLFPVFWGAAFSRVAGAFSFAAVRWSTLTISVVGCFGTYDLLRQTGLPFRSAWIGALTLAVSPLYIYLSYTFMSDVFFFAPLVLSLAWYCRGIARGSNSALLVGSVVAAVADLARQLGITLPIAAVLALVLRDRRLSWRPAACASVVPVLVLIAHSLWLAYVNGVPWGFELQAVDNSFTALLQPMKAVAVVWGLLVSLIYLGILTLPALVAIVPSLKDDRANLKEMLPWFGAWFVAMSVFVVLMVTMTGGPMPYLSNVINRTGIGPLGLPGDKTPATPAWVFWVVTICAPLAGAVQGTLWTRAVLGARRHSAAGVVVIASVLMALLTAAIVMLWDEYLIVFIPAGLYLVLRFRPITGTGAAMAVGVCALMFLYGQREMADYMGWNTARWSAGRRLVAQGVPPEAIDAGFEWEGWYQFESALPKAIAAGKGRDLFGWMGMTPRQYRLAFSVLDGHDLVDAVPYGGPVGGQVYVLKPRSIAK